MEKMNLPINYILKPTVRILKQPGQLTDFCLSETRLSFAAFYNAQHLLSVTLRISIYFTKTYLRTVGRIYWLSFDNIWITHDLEIYKYY